MWSERAKGFRQLVVTVSMDAVQRGYRSTSGHEMRIEQSEAGSQSNKSADGGGLNPESVVAFIGRYPAFLRP